MSFLSAIFAPGEQERSDELDQRRIELEKRRAERGLITQAEAERNIQDIYGQRADVGADIDGAFLEGAREGYAAETGAIKSTLAAPFKFAWDALPWQLLIVGAVVLFLYLGGASLLKGILIRK